MLYTNIYLNNIMHRIAVLISGRGSNLLALIEGSINALFSAEIVCVIANCEASGLQHAKKYNIPYFVVPHTQFKTRELFDREINSILQDSGVNFICLAGFMRMLSPYFIKEWQNKIINIHPSLLPAFKGLNAQQQALDAGVKVSGCTVHFVNEELDAGKIIVQSAVPVLDGDNVDTLSDRILAVEHKCYVEALKILFKNA